MDSFEVESPITPTPKTDLEIRILRANMTALLYGAITLMVDKPEDVKIEFGDLADGSTQMKIITDGKDCGKVIGKHGRNIRAIRIILLAISRTKGHSFTVDVVDANEDKRAMSVGSTAHVTPDPYVDILKHTV